MDKDKQIKKTNNISLERLSEQSKLVKKGLRDLGILPSERELLRKVMDKYNSIFTSVEERNECIKLCEEILSTDPNQYLTLYYYGLCLRLNGTYDKAIGCATKILTEWRDDDYLAYKLRADSYFEQNKYKEAFEDYLEWIKLDDDLSFSSKTIGRMAECAFNLGDVVTAHKYIDQAIQLDDLEEKYILRKAEFFEFQGKREEAVEQYKRLADEGISFNELAEKKISELSRQSGQSVEQKKDFTDHELRLKAAGVNFAIHTISDLITKNLQKEVKDLNDLKQEDINKMFFVVSYVCLFNAQRFFWENFIQIDNQALIFEKHLFDMFKNTTGLDPRPFIKDLVDYVGVNEPSREVQYIGSKLCREFGKEDALLMFDISIVFASFLKHGFFESMKNAWELPDKTLEEMLQNMDKES